MTPRSSRTVRADAKDAALRRARAIDFWQSAEDLSELGGDPNSMASLYILAGIAASDAICASKLGEHSIGENHADALAVLRRADPSLVASLQRLLSRKTEAGYGGAAVSTQRLAELRRAAERLVQAAQFVPPGR